MRSLLISYVKVRSKTYFMNILRNFNVTCESFLRIFDVTCESYQNWFKTYFMNILRIFDDHYMCHQS